MLVDYQKTKLWKNAFEGQKNHSKTDEQQLFSTQLNLMRERVKPIVDRIFSDMIGYTVHDISHLDALWETASLLATEEIQLNAPEAFVFGGAVLLHDAGMTLAAYPDGITGLRKTVQWKDTIALLKNTLKTERKTWNKTKIEAIAKVEVLRQLHAPTAERLATQGWPNEIGSGGRVSKKTSPDLFLIENSDIREFYGRANGRIAHSHWWDINRVEAEFIKSLGAMPPYTNSEVNLLKIACLLRVADAIHLDRRRAPNFVRAIDKPSGISALHWNFQSKLAFPRIESDVLIFTSGATFSEEEAESLWCGYDAINLADKELYSTNLLLKEHTKSNLSVTRIKGANDPEALSKLIKTTGWRPIDTKLKVGNVAKIVEQLGGLSLYGKDYTAPLREIMQNAIDAIQARRKLESRSNWGVIKCEVFQRNGAVWLSVEDNGIGMSDRVLTETLLDFGKSLWKSADLSEEFPSLASRGMSAAGRYGIGFFSVFMLGDEVKVFTKSFRKSSDHNTLLHFKNGLSTRSIISSGVTIPASIDGGTRVEVRLSVDPRRKNEFRLLPKNVPLNADEQIEYRSIREGVYISLRDMVKHLVPASDVTIDVREFDQQVERAINGGDWLDISSEDLITRCATRNYEKAKHGDLESRIRLVSDNEGKIYGRSALFSTRYNFQIFGCTIDHGISVERISWIAGALSGEVTNAPRSHAKINAPISSLSAWIKEQAGLISVSSINPEIKAVYAELILTMGGEIIDLPIGWLSGSWIDTQLLEKYLICNDILKVTLNRLFFDEEDDRSVTREDFDQNFEQALDVLFVEENSDFPSVAIKYIEPTRISTTRSYVVTEITRLISTVWERYSVEKGPVVIGSVLGEYSIRSGLIFKRA